MGGVCTPEAADSRQVPVHPGQSIGGRCMYTGSSRKVEACFRLRCLLYTTYIREVLISSCTPPCVPS